MPTSKEQRANRRKEANEDKHYALHNLWNISPHSAFYESFKRSIRLMSDMTMCVKFFHDHKLIEEFKANESDLRKIKTLCFYSYCFFCENGNKPIKRFSNITKEDYEIFKSQPHLQKSLDKDYQAILQRYLNSPIPEVVEPAIEQPEIDDFTFLSNAYLFEDNLTTIEFEDDLTSNIEENSVESFTPSQEHVSFPSN